MNNELIKRAEKIFLKYKEEHTKETSDQIAIKAMSYSGMPSGSPKDNPEEVKITSHIEAYTFCEQVRESINMINNKKYRDVLINKYIEEMPNSQMIADASEISRSTYFNIINPAMIAFAKICPVEIK
ncbi:DUF1492 domain-containing protein [Apilactobacillus timberlakei]|uniref:DUF1492 domain-containing protein n=1 Tax=Apilactobacillus timberlakei TaxID=2008380 RepID=UPI00112D961D|nr:DUF1492 domain-containing protein [Apilactobacillus timberlakei]TPR16668.1 DUF1492 domain-containing protein [Apilactobacillus timberlakei]